MTGNVWRFLHSLCSVKRAGREWAKGQMAYGNLQKNRVIIFTRFLSIICVSEILLCKTAWI